MNKIHNWVLSLPPETATTKSFWVHRIGVTSLGQLLFEISITRPIPYNCAWRQPARWWRWHYWLHFAMHHDFDQRQWPQPAVAMSSWWAWTIRDSWFRKTGMQAHTYTNAAHHSMWFNANGIDHLRGSAFDLHIAFSFIQIFCLYRNFWAPTSWRVLMHDCPVKRAASIRLTSIAEKTHLPDFMHDILRDWGKISNTIGQEGQYN